MSAATDNIVAVIAAYNEAGRVGEVVRRTRPYVNHVLVVDDGSKDDTATEARAAGAEVLTHWSNQGKGAALITGIARARQLQADWCLFLDADGQHDPTEILRFIEQAHIPNTTVVVGSRMNDTEPMPRLRCWANRIASGMLSRLIGQVVPDSQCGFRLLHQSGLESVKLCTARYDSETEMLIQLARSGHRIVSVPIRTIYNGQSSHIRPLIDTFRFLRLLRKYRHG